LLNFDLRGPRDARRIHVDEQDASMTASAERPIVLVVDDDDLLREFVVDLIGSFGYRVIAAADGLEAMRAITDLPSIALVFTDITMPGMNGLMLADMLKQHRPKLKILYTTGGSKVLRVKSEAGILHGNILEKPFRPEDLKREIELSLA
jgi:CheY-like chemotaxis protein